MRVIQSNLIGAAGLDSSNAGRARIRMRIVESGKTHAPRKPRCEDSGKATATSWDSRSWPIAGERWLRGRSMVRLTTW
jgi:hypothetical protein